MFYCCGIIEFVSYIRNLFYNISAAVCFVQGECIGNTFFLTEAEDLEECLQDCKDNLGCRWFTFHSFKTPKSMCILYYDCPTLDMTCDTCISGERRCQGSTTTTTSTTTTPEIITGISFIQFMIFTYSQTCLQQPPLGPKKSGRCTEVASLRRFFNQNWY